MRAAVFLAALVAATSPRADERTPRVPVLPAYQQECGACHVAYPPGLLPAASWRRLTGDLPRHFGVDASLDAPTLQAISTWLDAHASLRMKDSPAEDRITRSAWFLREHGELSAAVWKRPSVRSPSNCVACHAGAAEGDYSEHRVSVPR